MVSVGRCRGVRRLGLGRASLGLIIIGLFALSQAPALAQVEAPLEGKEEVRELPPLHQLLHDRHFGEPLGELGQQVRIWIWLDYMAFDKSQLRRLQRLEERYRERVAAMALEAEAIIEGYEAKLLPHYQSIYEALKSGDLSEEALGEMGGQLVSAQYMAERDDALRLLRVKTLRDILADEREFLYSLSPDQEQKLVSSLFFLRTVIDPFSNPGTYRDVVGSTWNAGDFTALLRSTDGVKQLDIGGIWGIEEGADRPPNYASIRRNVILFHVLREPALKLTLADMLEAKAK